MRSFIFLKVYVFGDLLILNALCYKYIVNITFKQFPKWCFTLWFYNFIKKWAKKNKKEKVIPFWVKNAKEKQNSATIMISVEWKGTVFPVKLKLQGEFTKDNFKKI